MVRGIKVALDDPGASDAWRSGRGVFDDAVQSRVFPGSEDPRAARQQKDLWKSVTHSPAWKEG
jgi:hypothetical protein